MNSSPLRVVAVSDDELRSELLDGLLVGDRDCDIIVVESISRAYSRIRELEPDLVVVFMDIADANACQLLSMLEIDRASRGIRVITSEREAQRRRHSGVGQFLGSCDRSIDRQLC